MTIVAYGYGISPGSGGGDGCTATLDAIEVEVVLEDPNAIFPPTVSTLDEIEIEVVMGSPKAKFTTDVAPPQFGLTVSGDIGGMFLGQSGQGRDRDRGIITSWGFTILEERPRAGRTDFIVHGGKEQAQFIMINRFDIQCSIPFTLYSLREGQEITVMFILNSNQGFSEL